MVEHTPSRCACPTDDPVDCVAERYKVSREQGLREPCECSCHDGYGDDWENDHYDSEPDSWRFNPPDRVGGDS